MFEKYFPAHFKTFMWLDEADPTTDFFEIKEELFLTP
jgi:hypothetical protein